MEMLKILIVEDEVLSAMGFQEQLLEFGYANVILAKDSFEAIYAFKNEKPDLVLMDITLEGSPMDGVQIAEVFNELRRVPIIYISSNTDNSTIQRAKKTNPASYLVKPCTDKQMEIAIDMAIDTFSDHSPFEEDAIFVKTEATYSKKMLPDRVVFHKPHGILEIVPVEEIVYCEADEDTTKVFLKGYKKDEKNENYRTFVAMRNLGFYAKRLTTDFSFFRVSDKILLNMMYLKSYYHNERDLKLTNGDSLSAARNGGKVLRGVLSAGFKEDTEG
jgi:two-component system, LytTR family, response regulator LytT